MACTPTYVYRDIHTFMHTCMNSYIKTSPPIITSTTDKGEMIFIHSFNPDISIAPLLVHYYSGALPTTVIYSLGVYTTKRYRQPYTVYTVYDTYYILLVKDLPKVPGVAARMGFEPTTFRSKGIESTNVPPRPTNINR